MIKPNRRDIEQGFTLVEVLVAVTILSLSLAVLLTTISSGLSASRRAQEQATLSAHAQSLLAEAGVTIPLDRPEQTGSFPDGTSWRLRTEPFGRADDVAAWPAKAVKVTIEVARDNDARVLTLFTVRLMLQGSP